MSHGCQKPGARKCYVAVTRAKRELHLSYCRQEYQHVRVVKLAPSRFLGEMARVLADEESLNYQSHEGGMVSAPGSTGTMGEAGSIPDVRREDH